MKNKGKKPAKMSAKKAPAKPVKNAKKPAGKTGKPAAKAKPAKAPKASKAPKMAAKKPVAKPAAKPAAKPKPAAKKAEAGHGKHVPQGYAWVNPYLIAGNVKRLVEFYEKAFGMKCTMSMPGPDGDYVHAEVRHEDQVIMVGHSPDQKAAPHAGGTIPIQLYVYTKNVDQFVEHAQKAGATIKEPPTDKFYGDRVARIDDPEGFAWYFATHTRDVSPAEMAKAAEEMHKQAAAQHGSGEHSHAHAHEGGEAHDHSHEHGHEGHGHEGHGHEGHEGHDHEGHEHGHNGGHAGHEHGAAEHGEHKEGHSCGGQPSS